MLGMLEPELLAHGIGLVHVSDETPGIHRRRCGGGFCYFEPSGRALRDRKTLDRIRSLVIPPAWQDVWICPRPRGHIQATGRDDKGRKQYVYHEKWRRLANLTKFTGLTEFAQVLPRLRRAVRDQLADKCLCCDKLLALLVSILDRTGMRVGNEEYAETNESFGLTTLRKSHLRIGATGIEFRYRGKSGQKQLIAVGDPELIEVIKECAALPGRMLFQFRGDKKTCSLTSYDVNDYLRRLAGNKSISAKDFRTWKGTVLAAEKLYELRDVKKPRLRKKLTTQAVREVADRLGNTPTVCRTYYIHPFLIESFLDGRFQKLCATFQPRRMKWLTSGEQLVLHCLKAQDLTPELAKLSA